MPDPPLKFPRTPHLAWLGSGHPRDDKVLAENEAARFFQGPVLLEEKIDGANIGMSMTRSGELLVWNRGTVLGPGAHPQFQRLWPWLAERRKQLESALPLGRVFFGEWCFARHTVAYTRLPDWFLLFDVYEAEPGEFWSTPRRDRLARDFGISVVPSYGRVHLSSAEDVLPHTEHSHFGEGHAEGAYLRLETDTKLLSRAKLVRPEFTQTIEQHWSKRHLEKNALAHPETNRCPMEY